VKRHTVNSRRPVIALCLLRFGAFGASAWAEEELVDNPAYTSWASHKPDTTVTHEMKMTASGMEMTTEMTQKLLEVTPDAAVIEVRTKTQVMGQTRESPAQKNTIKAKVPKSEADMSALPPGTKGTVKEAGNETVTVAGNEYDCKVIEFTGEHQGMTSKGKAWMSDAVPGNMVKTEVESEGQMASKMTMQLVSIDAK
jgi:hypothetical protein